MTMLDPANIASRLTGPQRRRLIALAQAGKSLTWNRTDPALERLRLIQKYTGTFGEAFSELNSNGMAVAKIVARSK